MGEINEQNEEKGDRDFFEATDKKAKKKNPIKWFFNGLWDFITDIFGSIP